MTSKTENQASFQDWMMAEATDFFSTPKDLALSEENAEQSSLLLEESKWSWELKPKMTEPSDFFSLEKTAWKIKDGTFDAVEATFDTGVNLAQGVLDTSKGFVKEVGTIWSGKEWTDIDGPAMTEPSDFFSPKKLAKWGKSLVKKTFATGEAGVRAGVSLGKETIEGVRKLWTGLWGKLGTKKKKDIAAPDENDWEEKSK